MKAETLTETQASELTLDYLIARSGLIGRQILRFARFVHEVEDDLSGEASDMAESRLRRRRLLKLRRLRRVSHILALFYVYYFGGSLTRTDQITFARLRGMNDDAFKLTLFNALFCGLPCALGYFLLGEGFSLLKEVHTYAELPSLFARHTSLSIGAASLLVDLFRIVDAWWNHRCWAPFGFIPFVINMPTYLKRLFQRFQIVSATRDKNSINLRYKQ